MSTASDRHDGVPSEGDALRARFESVAPVILVDPGPVLRRGRRRRLAARAGAGLGVVAAVLAVALLVRPGGGLTGPAATTPPPAETSVPVAIALLPAVVAPGDVMTAVLVASEPNDLTFGVAGRVERWTGSEWRRVGDAYLCLVEWACTGRVLDRLEAVEDIGLGATDPAVPGATTTLSTAGLTDGWYRLVQEAALEDGVATGVFEVRTGAVAAPPLPAQDAVRLTVSPVLVPTQGALVRVATQVPAGADGSLSAEDIEEVDSALSGTVQVQRWDGTAWDDVAEVPLGQREPDMGVEWGNALALPPLGEGSYRVVRQWSQGEAPWGVFTVSRDVPGQPAPTGD